MTSIGTVKCASIIIQIRIFETQSALEVEMVPLPTIVTLVSITLHAMNMEPAYVTLYILETTDRSTLVADVILFVRVAQVSKTPTV